MKITLILQVKVIFLIATLTAAVDVLAGMIFQSQSLRIFMVGNRPNLLGINLSLGCV